jgi:KTSC domain
MEASMLYVDLFDSRAIAMFAYDLVAKSLLIRFKTGEVYIYQGVPREIFDRFRQARSKGQFFHSTIRDRFVSRRLAAGEIAAIARMHRHAGGFGVPASVRVDIAALERPWKAAIFF